MLTIAISLLLGLIAFAAVAQISVSVNAGMKRARLILAELSGQERAPIRATPARLRDLPSGRRLAVA